MLTGKEKRELRSEGHHLKPEIWVGKEGITDGTLTNVENAFNTKELLKIKLQESCPLEKELAGEILARKTHSELVQIIGSTILLFREQPEEKIKNRRAKKVLLITNNQAISFA